MLKINNNKLSEVEKMSEQAERFISAYNRIDQKINFKDKEGRKDSFYQALIKAKDKNPVIRNNLSLLSKYGDLRNAIVHEKTRANYTIADPHIETVEKIENIAEQITAPKKVIPTFKKNVQSFQTNDTLVEMLNAVDKENYTQFPVYDKNNFEGLITENGLARWLAKTADKDLFSLRETTLKEVLSNEEETYNYKFVNRNTNVYEIEDLFKDTLHNKRFLDALLITENGRETEKLLGIITTWDVIEY